jgi:hypothetical protein
VLEPSVCSNSSCPERMKLLTQRSDPNFWKENQLRYRAAEALHDCPLNDIRFVWPSLTEPARSENLTHGQ